jgi:hypothetical protein
MWAGIVTAIASGITAVGGIIVAMVVLMPALRIAKETHKLVNQTRTDALNYQNALIRALRAGGIEVPIDQSLPNGDIQDGTP